MVGVGDDGGRGRSRKRNYPWWGYYCYTAVCDECNIFFTGERLCGTFWFFKDAKLLNIVVVVASSAIYRRTISEEGVPWGHSSTELCNMKYTL